MAPVMKVNHFAINSEKKTVRRVTMRLYNSEKNHESCLSFVDDYPPSERSETGGYTVFTFVCLSVCLCVCAHSDIGIARFCLPPSFLSLPSLPCPSLPSSVAW